MNMKKAHGYLFEHQVDESKPKKIIFDTIFRKQYDFEERDIPFGDLPTDLQPTDILIYTSDPGYQSDNNAWGPFTAITVQRPRIETDDEQAERLENSRLYLEKRKEDRRSTFLRLKEEFEPTDEKK